MPDDVENKIRERAYHLWRESGCIDGDSNRHWLAAEREVLAAFAASAQTTHDSGAKKVTSTPKAKARAASGARRRAS